MPGKILLSVHKCSNMMKESSFECSASKKPKLDEDVHVDSCNTKNDIIIHANISNKLSIHNLNPDGENNGLDSFDSNVTEEYSLEASLSDDDKISGDDKENILQLQREDTHPIIKVMDEDNQEESLQMKKSCSILSGIPVRKIESVYEDAKLIKSIISDIDIDSIYNKLKEKRKEKNRVDIVTNEILENLNASKQERKASLTKQNSAGAVIEDFVKVIDKVMANIEALPVSADDIHKILNSEKHREDRVDRVVAFILRLHFKPRDDLNVVDANHETLNLKKEDSLPADQTLRNDPIFRDMHIIRKILPDKEPNEIYAFLEAHYHEKNRIRLVVEELIKTNDGNESLETSSPNKEQLWKEKIVGTQKKSSIHNKDGSGREDVSKHDSETWTIKEEIEELLQIFPDCDPNYLFSKLEEKMNDAERVKNIAIFLLDNKNYPKHKNTPEKQKKEQQIEEFEVDSFLHRFPDPAAIFSNKNRKTSEMHRECVQAQLLNDFPLLKDKYLNGVLNDNNFNYTLCRQAISKYMTEDDDFSFNIYRKTPRQALSLPEKKEDYFLYEIQFNENEMAILERIENEKMLKEMKVEEARVNNELMECGCCFDNECLFEDMVACSEGHLFCKECIQRSSEVIIGEGKCEFPCLGENCSGDFCLRDLQQIMTSNMYSILLRRIQEEEVKKADFEDLVCCPFCSFATIMPNSEDKVLKCLNPDCLKDSCRLCKEPNHIPLRCNEIEKQGETSMRAFIENKVSEAMLRTCHACKKRFYKDAGCNKMTCTCGATQCYVCRETNIDYSHFNTNERCQLTDDANTIHVQDMEAAIKSAREQYIREHPEAEDIVLKYDPEKHIEDLKKGVYGGFTGAYDDEDLEYDEYNEEEYD